MQPGKEGSRQIRMDGVEEVREMTLMYRAEGIGHVGTEKGVTTGTILHRTLDSQGESAGTIRRTCCKLPGAGGISEIAAPAPEDQERGQFAPCRRYGDWSDAFALRVLPQWDDPAQVEEVLEEWSSRPAQVEADHEGRESKQVRLKHELLNGVRGPT